MVISHSTTAAPPPPLLILLHGGALSSQMFRTTLPYLSVQSFSILTPDLPGHGPTASTTGPFSFPASYTLVTDLIRTARSKNPSQKIILVGVSLGGQVVLDYIQRQQHATITTTTTTTAAATTTNEPHDPPPRANDIIDTHIDGAIVASAPIQPPTSTTPWEMPHLPSSSPTAPASDQEWTRVMTADIAHLGSPTDIQAIQTASFAFRFSPITTSTNTTTSTTSTTATATATPHRPNLPPPLPPTLLITGEHDVAMARRDVGVIAERIREARGGGAEAVRVEMRVLEGAWHNHPIDVPEMFAGVVGEWVREICG